MARNDIVIVETAETAPPKPKGAGKTPRLGRKRSKIACRHCRRRKVRCDVCSHGAPCTNCHLDGIDCTLLQRKRKSTNRKPQDVEAMRPLSSPPNDNLRGYLDMERGSNLFITTFTAEPDSSAGPCQAARYKSSREVQFLGNQRSPVNLPDEGILDENLAAWETSPRERHAAATTPKEISQEDIPPFIRCDLSHLSKEDVSYLQSKGCFTLPERDVLDDLLKTYFDFVHTHVPFLDEQEFWETYLNRNPKRPHLHHTDGYEISLLLFRAVLFAATTCASLSLLRQAGYTSRRVARRDTFSKVRVLYSLDTERDKMVLLQTLLLMSFWRGAPDEDKDAWHWSGLATSLAYVLDLQCRPDTQLTERQRTLRKRCWWSCVLRDRLLALSEQRTPRLQLDECDVPLLTLADYNVGLRCAISELSPEEELGKRTALSMFSLQLIRLVLCVGKGNMSRPGGPSRSSAATVETWVRTRPTGYDDGSMTGLEDIDSWRLNLPEVLQRLPDSAGDETMLPCILLHRNALQVYYHKLILSVCVPRMLNSASREVLETNSQLAHRSSVALAKLYDELIDCDSIHCIPGECFGSSTCLEQSNPRAAQGFEPKPDFETHVAKIYTSILVGGGMPHLPSVVEQTISDPPALGLSAGFEPRQNRSTDSMDATDVAGCHQECGPTRGGTENEKDLDSGMNFVSDALWTLDDAEGYGGIAPDFPDLVADEPSTSTSDAGAMTPSTLPGLDALVFTKLPEFAKD